MSRTRRAFQKIIFFLGTGAWLALGTLPAQDITNRATSSSCLLEYRLVHPLHHIKARSTKGAFVITRGEDGTLLSLAGEVPVVDFDSGNGNRDSHAMEVVESPIFPLVKFQSTQIRPVPGALQMKGTLTFHGVEKELLVSAKWGGPLSNHLQGKFEISLTQFKVTRPALLFMPVKDRLVVLFDVAFPAHLSPVAPK